MAIKDPMEKKTPVVMDGGAEIIDRRDGEKECDEDYKEPQHEQQANLKVGKVVLREVLEIIHEILQYKLAHDKQQDRDENDNGHVDRQRGGYEPRLHRAPVLNCFVTRVKGAHQCEHPVR